MKCPASDGSPSEISRPKTRRLAISFCEDPDNIGFYFNLRFKLFHDTRVIICNSRLDNVWNIEQRETNFPFEPGTLAEVWFTFERCFFYVKLPDGNEFKFPNRLKLRSIKHMEIKGEFKFKSIRFD
uniref:Galectin n=1 Tax=Monodelphis domestica TaxID=13616 RepID=A0A5F8H765_MONDO